MNNNRINRFIAYFIDILIISILAFVVSKINFINPNAYKYEKTYEEFAQYSNQIAQNTSEINSIDDIITPKFKNYAYSIEKYGLSYTISEVVIVVLYFSLFAYFNNGSTIGQKLMRLKVVNNDDQKPSYVTFLVRSLIVPIVYSPIMACVLLDVITVILVLFLNASLFFKINIILTMLICVYCYIDIIMMLTSHEGKSLHDQITNTKLVPIGFE